MTAGVSFLMFCVWRDLELITDTRKTMTSVLIHGLRQLQGGTGDDVHPPRESVKQDNVNETTVSSGLNKVHDQPVQSLGSQSHDCHHRHEPAQQSNTHHSHHHHHHHHHHRNHHRKHDALSKDPSASVSGRLRKSPFPMKSLQEALAIVDVQSKPLPTETIRTGRALKNYVLAEDVFAMNDLPSTRTTNVDGYAVVAAEYNQAVRSAGDEAGLSVRVVRARATSGETEGSQVCVYRVNTGGPLPTGTDAVIMVEDTELVSS
jgi:gephyrin